jgi:hypothetical protein
MLTFLSRWFPSRSSYVSPEWLDALANRGSTEGWTEAPRIDWDRYDYQGPRRGLGPVMKFRISPKWERVE